MFPCSHCGRTFATAAQVRGHMAAVKAAATRRGRPAPNPPSAPPPPPPRRPAPPNPHPTNLRCGFCNTYYPAGTTHTCPVRPTPPPPPNPWAAPPRPTTAPSNGGGLWSTPKPTIESARADALLAFENLYLLVAADAKHKNGGKTPDHLVDAFNQYKKCLARALAPSPDAGSKNEADTALRVSMNQLVKLTF